MIYIFLDIQNVLVQAGLVPFSDIKIVDHSSIFPSVVWVQYNFNGSGVVHRINQYI